MTIGKIYYLATICGKLGWFSFVLAIPLLIIAGISMGCYCDIKFSPFKNDKAYSDELQLAKKCTKWTVISLMLIFVVSLLTPSKEDFLIIAMTKNYTPEQVYTMTKDELKNSIDYFVKQIKEIKK